MTFGFQSAVDIATDAIDYIHTTAASHARVFIVEVMGHKVGWLTLNAGMAGGADIILIPEIPYDINKVVEKIEERNRRGPPVHRRQKDKGSSPAFSCTPSWTAWHPPWRWRPPPRR